MHTWGSVHLCSLPLAAGSCIFLGESSVLGNYDHSDNHHAVQIDGLREGEDPWEALRERTSPGNCPLESASSGRHQVYLLYVMDLSEINKKQKDSRGKERPTLMPACPRPRPGNTIDYPMGKAVLIRVGRCNEKLMMSRTDLPTSRTAFLHGACRAVRSHLYTQL